MEKTYGYDETELILTDDAQFAYESDDYVIIEHLDSNGDVEGYDILLHEELVSADLDSDDVNDYFEKISDNMKFSLNYEE